MSEGTETLTLGSAKHDKLGIIHCGVTREGFIAVTSASTQPTITSQ